MGRAVLSKACFLVAALVFIAALIGFAPINPVLLGLCLVAVGLLVA